MLVVSLALGAWLLHPGSAVAEEGLVEVAITNNSNPVIDVDDSDQRIELSGEVVNTSAQDLSYLSVSFWVANTPITTQADLQHMIDSQQPEGINPPPYTEESGHTQVIARDVAFGAGERADFSVSAKISELNLPSNDAAYVLGVLVRGIPELGGSQTLGRSYILVGATEDNLEGSQVVQLTANPTQLASGEFANDDLAAQLDGRLETLLTAAEGSNVTTLLDPSLLDEVTALGKQHVVAGTTKSANGLAVRWVERVTALISQGRVRFLPYGNPDVVAAYNSGDLAETIERAQLLKPDTEIAVNLGSEADADLLTRLAELGVARAFGSNFTSGAIDDMDLIATFNPESVGMGPTGQSEPSQLLGRQAAQGAIAQTPPSYLVANESQLVALEPLTKLQETVEIRTATTAPKVSTATESAAIDQQVADRITELNEAAGFWAELTGSSEPETLATISARGLSQSFTTAEALSYLDANKVTAADNIVTLSASKSFVMGSESQSNRFPITLTNNADFPVIVRVNFESDAPLRISVPPSDEVTLQPGENLTVSVAPEATANGVAVVEAFLETREGTEFGKRKKIEITATNLGQVGWIIIILSSVVVLGGSFWRIRAVRAERAKEDRESG